MKPVKTRIVQRLEGCKIAHVIQERRWLRWRDVTMYRNKLEAIVAKGVIDKRIQPC